MRKIVLIRLFIIFALLLLYGISFSQYLIVLNNHTKALNSNGELKDFLSELKVQYERLTDLKIIQEKALNDLNMRYSNDSERIIINYEKTE